MTVSRRRQPRNGSSRRSHRRCRFSSMVSPARTWTSATLRRSATRRRPASTSRTPPRRSMASSRWRGPSPTGSLPRTPRFSPRPSRWRTARSPPSPSEVREPVPRRSSPAPAAAPCALLQSGRPRPLGRGNPANGHPQLSVPVLVPEPYPRAPGRRGRPGRHLRGPLARPSRLLGGRQRRRDRQRHRAAQPRFGRRHPR